MKNIFIGALLLLSVYGKAQNLFGEYTARDFILRNATQVSRVTIKTDTITNKQKTDGGFIASYNPKTKIIGIVSHYKKYNESLPDYKLTDTLNELYNVDKNGNEDTNLWKPTRVEYLKKGVIKYGNEYRFYNEHNKVIRIIADTTDNSYALFSEWNFEYKNDTLIKRIWATYTNTEFRYGFNYNRNRPNEIVETTFLKNKEIGIHKIFDEKTGKTTITNIVTEIEAKKIVSKEYCNGKLLRISTTEFK